jgi:hypothetical protein
MIDKDALVRSILSDGPMMAVLRTELDFMLRPIRHSTGLDFDLRRETRFEMPDSMDMRAHQLISDYAHHIVDKLLPTLRKEAADEAKHNLIRKLGQVLQ